MSAFAYGRQSTRNLSSLSRGQVTQFHAVGTRCRPGRGPGEVDGRRAHAARFDGLDRRLVEHDRIRPARRQLQRTVARDAGSGGSAVGGATGVDGKDSRVCPPRPRWSFRALAAVPALPMRSRWFAGVARRCTCAAGRPFGEQGGGRFLIAGRRRRARSAGGVCAAFPAARVRALSRAIFSAMELTGAALRTRLVRRRVTRADARADEPYPPGLPPRGNARSRRTPARRTAGRRSGTTASRRGCKMVSRRAVHGPRRGRVHDPGGHAAAAIFQGDSRARAVPGLDRAEIQFRRADGQTRRQVEHRHRHRHGGGHRAARRADRVGKHVVAGAVALAVHVDDAGGIASERLRQTFERAVRGPGADEKFDGFTDLAARVQDDLDGLALVDLDFLRLAVGGGRVALLAAALEALTGVMRLDGFLDVRARRRAGKPPPARAP